MKFIINKEVLLKELEKLIFPTTTKQNFPILNCVYISTQNNLKFITTDLDITIISTNEANILKEGVSVIPMKRFISIIREFPNKDITIEKQKNNLLITCEQIEFKLNILSEEEFPKIDEVKNISFIKINPPELEKMIQLTSFCVGYEDTNYVLNGILFEIFEDNINLVSTDGRRLSFVTQKLPKTQPNIKNKISFVLPIKAVNELEKLIKNIDDEVLLAFEENKVIFDLKNTQFIARPIEGEFPNYSQYIPKESKNKLTINRQQFLSALKRADILSLPDYQGVKLELKKNELVVLKQTPQLGEVKEIINTQYSGNPLQIGFNPKFLIDVLRNLEDEYVNFEFVETERQLAVLRKENFIHFILPLRI
ncbi:MAG: DNA polymerase III subunit beta [Candidatus Omnitrophica bacterium]|nr:DNA polymerase III subunit beta [Candidatus Omnitrophota bacterium]